jgi:nucleoside-triphosphatase
MTLIIVTGNRGAGKTTFCTRLIELTRSAGRQTAGVLSPAVFVNDQKVAIDVIDLHSDQRRRLAEFNPQADYPRELYWRFEAEALRWGDAILREAVSCDVLIVDELGVLEFERGEGWQAGLAAIDARDYRLGVVVIRPELLSAALQRWPQAQVIEIDQADQAAREADRVSREFLSDQIADGQIHHRLV